MVHDKMYSREALRVGGSALGTGQPPVWLPHRVNRSADHCNNMNSRSNHLTSSALNASHLGHRLGLSTRTSRPHSTTFLSVAAQQSREPAPAKVDTPHAHALAMKSRRQFPNASVSKEVLWIKLYERPPHTSINCSVFPTGRGAVARNGSNTRAGKKCFQRQCI
jgi:hypothetical protein